MVVGEVLWVRRSDTSKTPLRSLTTLSPDEREGRDLLLHSVVLRFSTRHLSAHRHRDDPWGPPPSRPSERLYSDEQSPVSSGATDDRPLRPTTTCSPGGWKLSGSTGQRSLPHGFDPGSRNQPESLWANTSHPTFEDNRGSTTLLFETLGL